MMRTLAGLAVTWCALQLAELARWLLPKRPEAPAAPAPPPPATLVPPDRERYVRDLVRLELVRADALLGFVLSRGPVFFNGSTFAKIPDTRWRQ